MKQKIFGVTTAKLTASFGQTVYMVGLSLFFGAILGILLALALDAAFTAASEYSELLQTRRV